MIKINSKLPEVGTTIFTVMSKLAQEHKALNLSQGFPNFDCSERLKDLVHHYMKKGKNQYAPMTGVPQLRHNIAAKIKLTHHTEISPDEEITVTAGATQALNSAISSVVHPGDEVIIVEPAFDSYRPSIEVNGGICIPYALSAPDFRIDWDEIARLISDKTKLLILNNPHNPTGKIFCQNDLEALKNLLDGTDILLISDEVYEHLVFDNNEHLSVLRYPELYRRSFVIFSFGKTFHATGWKIGYCVAPPALSREFRKVHQFCVFAVNTPVQHAIADFLEEPNEYLQLPEFYQQKRDFFLEAMLGSRFKPIASEGTYFQLFDYSAISSLGEFEFAKLMTTEYGVAVIPVSVFYTGKKNQNVIRLCFAKTEKTLSEAGRLLKKV